MKGQALWRCFGILFMSYVEPNIHIRHITCTGVICHVCFFLVLRQHPEKRRADVWDWKHRTKRILCCVSDKPYSAPRSVQLAHIGNARWYAVFKKIDVFFKSRIESDEIFHFRHICWFLIPLKKVWMQPQTLIAWSGEIQPSAVNSINSPTYI